MPLRFLTDHAPASWVLNLKKPAEDAGLVGTLIPLLQQQAKLLHSIFLGPASEKRVLWADLAEREGLEFHPEINDMLFETEDLSGPQEGEMDATTCEALVNVLGPDTNAFFYYSGLSTDDFSKRLYAGPLHEVTSLRDCEGIRLLPEYWWPEDRSWCIYCDYDLRFTLLSGTADLLRRCAEHPDLECLAVTPATRVDNSADQRNYRHCVRQKAELLLQGKLRVSAAAEGVRRLRAIADHSVDSMFDPFEKLCRELSKFPTGADPRDWTPELLAQNDRQVRALEDVYRSRIIAASREIVSKF